MSSRIKPAVAPRKGAPSRAKAERGSSPPPVKASLLPTDASRRLAEYASPDDKCPVCFSDRYLNPKLRLLVSKCYHKMCESCIDRIFTLGPAPCPTCNQTIRKTNFTPQTFEDLGVEKEVVIRKRISKYFNKRESDFATLKDYNNYLEEVEDITFNLINQVDVAATEERIRQFRQANADLIDQNMLYNSKELEMQRLQDEEERRLKLERKKEFERLDELEKKQKAQDKQEVIKALEQSDASTAKILATSKNLALKRSNARTQVSDSVNPSLFSSLMSRGGNIAIETIPEPVLESRDDHYDYTDLFEIPSDDSPFGDDLVEHARTDPIKLAGGYKIMNSYYEVAVRTAVMGLWTPMIGALDAQGDIQMSVI